MRRSERALTGDWREDEWVEWRGYGRPLYEIKTSIVRAMGSSKANMMPSRDRSQRFLQFRTINGQWPATQFCDRPIVKFAVVGRKVRVAASSGIYSPLALFHFTLCPSKLVPGNKATKLPQLRFLLSSIHRRVQTSVTPLDSVILLQTGTRIQ